MVRSAVAARVGGLIAIGFDGTTIQDAPVDVFSGLAGAVLFKRNITSREQIRALVDGLQSAIAPGAPPLLVAIDEEGGTVSRSGGIGTWMPSAMLLGAAGDPRLTESAYAATGEELAALGVTLDFAPVADVNTNPRNPVIGVRSFGERPAQVGAHVGAAIRGLHASGIAAAAKHFPGHGDASVDSHFDLPTVEKTLDDLRAVDLVPFESAIAAGADMMMTAHIWFPALDLERLPATLSPTVIRGLLRRELGYDGVVCTDCLQMRAIADSFGPGDAAVRAVAAGADIVLFSHPLDAAREARQALESAVLDGTLDAAAVEKSLERVERIRSRPQPHDRLSVGSIGTAERKQRAADVAQRGVTLVRDRGRVLPLAIRNDESLAVVHFGGAQLTPIENNAITSNSLGAALRGRFNVDDLSAGSDPPPDRMSEVTAAAARAAAIVCVTYRASLHPSQSRAVSDLALLGKPVVVVAAREPYDADVVPAGVAVIAAYGDDPATSRAVAAVIAGDSEAAGSLPVTLASVAQ